MADNTPIETKLAEDIQKLLADTAQKTGVTWKFPKVVQKDIVGTTKNISCYTYKIEIAGTRGVYAEVSCHVKQLHENKKKKIKFDIVSIGDLERDQFEILRSRAEEAVGEANVIASVDGELHVDIADVNPLDKKLLGIEAILIAWNKKFDEGTGRDNVEDYVWESREDVRRFAEALAKRAVDRLLESRGR